jgi:DNA-binding NarL/FixJ family response regulator
MKEIAHPLKLKPGTVAFLKCRMMEALGLKSTAALIEYALKRAEIAGMSNCY